MKTPLKNVRGLGSAKSGTEHFWHQRLTALLNVPLMIFLAWFIVRHAAAPRADIIASVKLPWVAITLLLTMASMLWHMRLGLQVVIEDYVHGHGRKFALLIANSLFAVFLFAVATFSILKMSFAL